ncbi:MAG: cell division protein FtsQ/DivIB [Anaerolineae bacterium]
MNRKPEIKPIRPRPARRPGRRSQRRLAGQSVRYETTAPRMKLTISPALNLWQTWGSRILGLFVLALLAWITTLLFTEDAFYIYGAEIEGNVVLTPEEIYGASQIDSQSVFWIDPNQVATNVARLPNVKTASVRVRLPSRVTITVQERLPNLLWQSGDTIWWVDGEGTVVPPRSDITGQTLIIDDDARPLVANERLDPTLIKGVNSLRQLRPDLHELHYSGANGLTIATPEGWPVYLGNGEDIPAKLTTLEAIRFDLLARNVTPEFIDVRYPRRVVYR